MKNRPFYLGTNTHKMEIPRKARPKFTTHLGACKFPGCQEQFMVHCGFGRARLYCDEHRREKYRKEKDILFGLHRFGDNGPNPNCLQNPGVLYAKSIIELNCACCGKPYRVELIPKVSEYTRYCPEHRNHFKREMYEHAQSQG